MVLSNVHPKLKPHMPPGIANSTKVKPARKQKTPSKMDSKTMLLQLKRSKLCYCRSESEQEFQIQQFKTRVEKKKKKQFETTSRLP